MAIVFLLFGYLLFLKSKTYKLNRYFITVRPPERAAIPMYPILLLIALLTTDVSHVAAGSLTSKPRPQRVVVATGPVRVVSALCGLKN